MQGGVQLWAGARGWCGGYAFLCTGLNSNDILCFLLVSGVKDVNICSHWSLSLCTGLCVCCVILCLCSWVWASLCVVFVGRDVEVDWSCCDPSCSQMGSRQGSHSLKTLEVPWGALKKTRYGFLQFPGSFSWVQYFSREGNMRGYVHLWAGVRGWCGGYAFLCTGLNSNDTLL